MLDKRFHIGELLQNRCVAFAQKQLNKIFRDRGFKKVSGKLYRSKNELTSAYKIYNEMDVNSIEAKKYFEVVSEKQSIYDKNLSERNKIVKSYSLTEHGLQAYLKELRYKYDKHMDANTVQNIATNVSKGVDKIIDGKAKKLHFVKFGNLNSVSGKDTKAGLRLRQVTQSDISKFNNKLEKQNKANFKNQQKKLKALDSKYKMQKAPKHKFTNRFHGMKLGDYYVIWNNLIIPVDMRMDEYTKTCLQDGFKFFRLVKTYKKNKHTYSLQIACEGSIPEHRYENLKPNRILAVAKAPIGLDIGTSTLALSSKQDVFIKVLAESVDTYSKSIRRLSRKLNRSRRFTNPQNFNDNGTVKKGHKTWYRSKNYIKILYKLKNLYNRAAAKRKQEHCRLANYVLSLGTDIYVEKMNFKALQKRAKKTEISQKTGKCKRKKRYGKSLLTHAPAMFLDILKYKIKAKTHLGYTFNEVNTWTFKASKYNHSTDEYEDVTLNDRWKEIENSLVQRDIYSAFLLMNSCEHLKHTDREKCLKHFKKFKTMHDEYILYLKNTKKKYPVSFGLKDINEKLEFIEKEVA